jgi:16S rRNA (guanine1207-N2)-methyltransferase
MRSAPEVTETLLGHPFQFRTAPGLFSADRVDDGTLLLLHNLPKDAPSSVLDVGCGYGALGLPVAAEHPEAACTLLDRDIRAASVCADNAAGHGLSNVNAVPGLGYRDLPPDARFDWVLCNVPARIGPAGVAHLMGEGARRLNPGGALHAVVIRDLVPVVEEAARTRGWPLRRVASGERHSVLALPPLDLPEEDALTPYARDSVTLDAPGGPITLERPHDISQDPEHLREGLPLLLDLLPRRTVDVSLCIRTGYGAVALALARAGSVAVTVDRDLLCSAFVQRNAAALGLNCSTVDSWRAEDARSYGPFDLVVLDHTATGAGRPDQEEVAAVREMVAEDGQLMVLGRSRALSSLRLPGALLGSRGAYGVWLSGATALRGKRSRRRG